MNPSLITLAEMKTYLNIDVGNTQYDAFLTQQIALVSDAIQNYCRRVFKATTWKETFYSERVCLFPKNTLPLHQYPVISIESFDDVYPSTPTDVVTEVVGYRIHKPTGRLMDFNHDSYLSRGSHLEVVYRAGYETIPPTVLSVVYDVVSERYNKKVFGIDLNFGSDVQSINIPGTIGVNFDYSLQGNERSSTFGVILGNNLNALDYWRSDRAIVPDGKLTYIEEVI